MNSHMQADATAMGLFEKFFLPVLGSYVLNKMKYYKKLDLQGIRQLQTLCLKRRTFHTSRHNLQTPAPPIHNGTAAHVRLTRP